MAKKLKDLTLEFIPYSELAYLSSYRRVKKLLGVVAENKIVLFQGKLSAEEEADLIEETMRKVGKMGKFKGIELAAFSPSKDKALSFFPSMREKFANALFGERDVLTVIGPATIVKEIKKDPTKIQLMLRK